MAGTTDFVPFATGSTANVTAQATYIAEATTGTGFQPGEASSADCNKVWRQATFQAAVVATFTANQLSINVPDDGNLTNAVSNFTSALTSLTNSLLTSYATESWVTSQNYATVTYASNASNLSGGTLDEERLPASFTVGGTITAGSFNSTSDERLKKDIRPIENPLERALKIRGVFFRWLSNGEAAAGVLAQEVRDVFPEAVHEREDGTLSVDPLALIGLLFAALSAEHHERLPLE